MIHPRTKNTSYSLESWNFGVFGEADLESVFRFLKFKMPDPICLFEILFLISNLQFLFQIRLYI